MLPGAREVVGRGLARRIRAARVVGRGLGEGRVAVCEGTEHLVGGDVVKAETRARVAVQRGEMGARGFEQGEGADHVGADERRRTVDGTIDVAFRRQVHDCVGAVFGEDGAHGVRVGNVGHDQGVARVAVRVLERVEARGRRSLNRH